MRQLRAGALILLILLLSVTAFSLLEHAVSDEAASAPASRPAAPDKAQAGPFKPVQPVETLMEGQQKLYGDLKLAVVDRSWAEAGTLAWLLAELANVNQYQHDDPQYRAFARTMSEQCVDLAGALRSHDPQTAKAGIGRIAQTCKACHKQFKQDD